MLNVKKTFFAPAAPQTRGIKVEEYFSQDLVQIYLKKLRHNISRHFSGKREFMGSQLKIVLYPTPSNVEPL